MTRIANQDFTLTRDDCRPLYFKAGDEIPAEYEEHWFVLLHSDERAAAEVASDVAVEEKRKPGRPAKP
ncbi:hypothetical protein [Paraburkholderia antibiotica]|uniref:Uncharacterized protein n=1 Tax=Paraburkholderia antibiotica TaxID=2728839 RepID=A0A7Y0A1U0_9BURK|nr:hypothetical protein [Paraburkholderia antibiotica]NML34942.1 hypothetical protein [Paraburkholderia antibiotica]